MIGFEEEIESEKSETEEGKGLAELQRTSFIGGFRRLRKVEI